MIQYLPYVFVGGGIGASLRFSISFFLAQVSKPWMGTFISNILGCLIFFLFHRLISNSPKELSTFLLTGMMGSLTTFSTFSFEVVSFIKMGRYVEAFTIFVLNIIVGFTLGIIILKG